MINYVFDTNVILYDPKAVNSFENAIVNIPITVIEEIDYFKNIWIRQATTPELCEVS